MWNLLSQWAGFGLGLGVIGGVFAGRKAEDTARRERDLLLHAYKDHVLQMNRLMADLTAVNHALPEDAVKDKLTKPQMAAFQRLMATNNRHNAMNQWPAGADGEPALHEFLEQHFPETFRLNGPGKYFFYLLARRGGEMHRDALKDFTIEFSLKFPGLVGAPALLSEFELMTHGFITRDSADSEYIRICEPYATRLKSLQLP